MLLRYYAREGEPEEIANFTYTKNSMVTYEIISGVNR
jgi:hypothetical protein